VTVTGLILVNQAIREIDWSNLFNFSGVDPQEENGINSTKVCQANKMVSYKGTLKFRLYGLE
jgi:hypothetical protein